MPLSYSTAVINVAAATTGNLVAAVTGRKISVHGYMLSADTAATIAAFKTGGAGGANISGNLRMAVNANTSMGFSDVPYFETLAGDTLDLTATTGAVTGFVRYSLGP